MKKQPKALVMTLSVIFIMTCIAGCSFQKPQKTTSSSASAQEENMPQYTGYTTIAFFGVDSRSQDDKGRSDVIMLFSIDNDSQKCKVISVYRDTLLNTFDESMTFRKANSAYAYGGSESAVSMLERNLDLDIDNYMTCDFKTVAKAINILGGVTIKIEDEQELIYLNKYIKNTNQIIGTHAKTIDSPGRHHLNGVQAVSYSRIRYTAGGDFKRTQRQRTIVGKVAKKLKKASLSQLIQLVAKVYPNIASDLSKKEMLNMVRAMRGYSTKDMRGFPFERTTETLSSLGSVVVPCDLENNVSELHEYLYGKKNYKVSDTVLSYSQQIIRITGKTADDAEYDEYNEADNDNSSQESDQKENKS